jgi:RHS repeat-associated protein
VNPSPTPSSASTSGLAKSQIPTLANVTLGQALSVFEAQFSAPDLSAMQSGNTYWAWRTLNDQAWIVVSFVNGVVNSVQLTPQKHNVLTVADTARVAMGSDLGTLLQRRGAPLGAPSWATAAAVSSAVSRPRVQLGEAPLPPSAGNVVLYQGLHGVKNLYGFDRMGHIDRIGTTLGDTAMPALIRWYQFSGGSSDRALGPADTFGGGQAGEEKYAALQACGGGLKWHVVSRVPTSVSGVTIDVDKLQCGTTKVFMTKYFTPTGTRPHLAVERPLIGSTTSTGMNLGVRRMSTSGAITPQVWFPPNNISGAPPVAQRWLQGATGGGSDMEFAYIEDPNDPIVSVNIVFGAPPSAVSSLARSTGTTSVHQLHSRLIASTSGSVGRLAGSNTPSTPQSYPCSIFGSGNYGKCATPPNFPPPGCTSAQLQGTTASGVTFASASGASACTANDPNQLPVNPYCPTCHGETGNPVDVISGGLRYEQNDVTLSGPFGLAFNHHYDSIHASNQLDMGVGWRDPYDVDLDLSNLALGSVTFIDASGAYEYFSGIFGVGTPAYDPIGNGTLTPQSNGTFVLTQWDKQVLTFDVNGKLIAHADRVGNTQQITRNAQEQITKIVDPLGRALAFTHDAQSRILHVTSVPSGVSVTFTYDSGTNCFSGDLCSATESDGSVWHYQYADPTQNSGQHLLTEVIDPRGNIEESNTYAASTLFNSTDYRVVHQEMQGGKKTLNFAYSGTQIPDGYTTVTDGLGRTTTYQWDVMLQAPLSISGPACEICHGASVTFSYDFFGRQTQEQESNFQLYQYQYGRDIVFTTPDGTASYPIIPYPSVTNELSGWLQGISWVTKTYAYYPLGDPRQDLMQSATESSADTAGQMASDLYTYTPQGLLTAVGRQGYVSGQMTTHVSTTTYDTMGRILSVVGPRTDVQQKTTLAYFSNTDADLARRGQLSTVTDALGHVTHYAAGPAPFGTYDLYGHSRSRTDPNGVIAEYTYDLIGRRTKGTLVGVSGDPKDLTITDKFDAAGNLIERKRPSGAGVLLQYDPLNALTALLRVDASGREREQLGLSHDAMERTVGKTYQACTTPMTICASWATDRTEAYTYDNLGDNLASVAYPGTSYNTVAYSWTNGGRAARLAHVNPYTGAGTSAVNCTGPSCGQVFGYDGLGNLNSSLESGLAQYSYDVQGNLASLTHFVQSGAGVQYTDTFTHDDFGNALKDEISVGWDILTGTKTYRYDPAGNVLTRTDANGATTTWTYDALTRPLTEVSVRSGAPTETVSWTYDQGPFGIGRRTAMTDPSGSTTWTYERRGLVASRTQVIGGQSYVSKYTYDADGNRETHSMPSGRVLTYGYDYADRPISVKSATSDYVSAATYLPFGPLQNLTFGNGVKEARAYDGRYHLIENKVTGAGSTLLSDVQYGYDPSGLLTMATDPSSPSASSSYTYAFAQDGNSMPMGTALLGGSQSGDFVPNTRGQQTQYTYDQSGENVGIRSFTQSAVGTGGCSQSGALAVTTNYVNYSNMQLSGVSPCAPGNPPQHTFSNDAAGNELSFDMNTYGYSSRELLASGDGLTYAYDGMRRRVMATLAGTGTRTSVYDDNGLLQTESALTSGAPAYEYIWFGSMPVAQENIGGTTQWTITGRMGEAFMQTTKAGKVAWQADYLPSGKISGLRTPDAHQPLRLPGQEAEELVATAGPNGVSGRFYNGARWYRPDYQRYTQPDSIGFNGSRYSLYAYAHNDPLEYMDSSGLDITVGLYPGLGGAGHIGLGVNTTTTTGFYPSQVDPNLFFGETVPGITQTDTQIPINSITIPTTSAQDQAVLGNMSSWNGSPYNLWTSNCAEQAANALNAAGLGVTPDVDPYTFFDNLENQLGLGPPPAAPAPQSGPAPPNTSEDPGDTTWGGV